MYIGARKVGTLLDTRSSVSFPLVSIVTRHLLGSDCILRQEETAIKKIMEFIHPPSILSSEGSMAVNWKHWKDQFLVFLKASGLIDKPTDVKASILMNLIGPVGEQARRNFDPPDEAEDLDMLMKKFNDYFDPKATETHERYTFFSSVRQDTETIDQYVKMLKDRSKTCDFGVLTEGLIRDKIILDVKNETLRNHLLKEPNVSLKETIDLWKICEGLEKVTNLSLPKNHQATQMKPACPPQPHGHTAICNRCGAVHVSNKQCPAIGQKCENCGMMNHLTKVCKKPSVPKTGPERALVPPAYFNPGPITMIPGLNKKNVDE